MLALPSAARSEAEAICPFPDNPDRCVSTGVKKGDPAPIDGDLFTVPYAVWLNQRVNSCPDEIEAAVTATASAFREDFRYQKTSLDADRRVVEVERDAHKREADRSFYQEPAFWMIVSVAAFIGGVLAGREFVKVKGSEST